MSLECPSPYTYEGDFLRHRTCRLNENVVLVLYSLCTVFSACITFYAINLLYAAYHLRKRPRLSSFRIRTNVATVVCGAAICTFSCLRLAIPGFLMGFHWGAASLGLIIWLAAIFLTHDSAYFMARLGLTLSVSQDAGARARRMLQRVRIALSCTFLLCLANAVIFLVRVPFPDLDDFFTMLLFVLWGCAAGGIVAVGIVVQLSVHRELMTHLASLPNSADPTDFQARAKALRVAIRSGVVFIVVFATLSFVTGAVPAVRLYSTYMFPFCLMSGLGTVGLLLSAVVVGDYSRSMMQLRTEFERQHAEAQAPRLREKPSSSSLPASTVPTPRTLQGSRMAPPHDRKPSLSVSFLVPPHERRPSLSVFFAKNSHSPVELVPVVPSARDRTELVMRTLQVAACAPLRPVSVEPPSREHGLSTTSIPSAPVSAWTHHDDVSVPGLRIEPDLPAQVPSSVV